MPHLFGFRSDFCAVSHRWHPRWLNESLPPCKWRRPTDDVTTRRIQRKWNRGRFFTGLWRNALRASYMCVYIDNRHQHRIGRKHDGTKSYSMELTNMRGHKRMSRPIQDVARTHFCAASHLETRCLHWALNILKESYLASTGSVDFSAFPNVKFDIRHAAAINIQKWTSVFRTVWLQNNMPITEKPELPWCANTRKTMLTKNFDGKWTSGRCGIYFHLSAFFLKPFFFVIQLIPILKHSFILSYRGTLREAPTTWHIWSLEIAKNQTIKTACKQPAAVGHKWTRTKETVDSKWLRI